MTGLFGSLGTATGGMSANQVALQTSSHNIANTNTDGYSRQRVNLQTQQHLLSTRSRYDRYWGQG